MLNSLINRSLDGWAWFRATHIPADFRATLVAAIVSTLMTWGWAAWARENTQEIYVYPDDTGFAQPMLLLDEAVRNDDDEGAIAVKYEPASVREMVVCEYVYLSGLSGREMLFSYLEKYPCASQFREPTTRRLRLGQTRAPAK